MEPWEEPDEAGYSEEEARRELVEKEIRRRIKKDSKKRRRERFRVGALQRGYPPRKVGRRLTVEWNFIQNKLGSILNDIDRLEAQSLHENDGGEECDAILTAFRRAKRRSARRAAKLLENHQDEDKMEIEHDEEQSVADGKALPNLKLTLNGH